MTEQTARDAPAAPAPQATEASEAQDTGGQLIRLALEIGPLVAFFIANGRYGIFVGTAVFMVATAIAITISLHREKRLPLMPIISCGFVMLFGGLTLVLADDLFIKLKPTVVNLLFAAILLIGLAVGRHPLKILMGSVLELTAEGWRALTLRWGLFFIVLAAINEIVWRNFSTDFWVTFKLVGLMPLTIAFGLAQIPLIMRHQPGAAGSGSGTAGSDPGPGGGDPGAPGSGSGTAGNGSGPAGSDPGAPEGASDAPGGDAPGVDEARETSSGSGPAR